MQQKQILLIGAAAVVGLYLLRKRAAGSSASTPTGTKPFTTVGQGTSGFGLPTALTNPSSQAGPTIIVSTRPTQAPASEVWNPTPAPAPAVSAPPPAPSPSASVWGQDVGPTRVEDGILYYSDGSSAYENPSDPRAIANGGWHIAGDWRKK